MARSANRSAGDGESRVTASTERGEARDLSEPRELSLEEVLKSYEQPVNEEQAWAVVYQCCSGLRAPQSPPGRLLRVKDPSSLLLYRDGTVALRRNGRTAEPSPSEQGGDQEILPQGGDQEILPQGGDQEILPQGGDQEILPQGGDQEILPQGGHQEILPQGGGSSSHMEQELLPHAAGAPPTRSGSSSLVQRELLPHGAGAPPSCSGSSIPTQQELLPHACIMGTSVTGFQGFR
ncbi:spire-like protein 2 [Oryzias melastigma]|uniref:Spire-like protein 2 n=1 Tax=Oryzias melastigma TaxID=30732 RepID=A0A834CCZ1_ORYME|nr:spire-like protein 2 [Oryzias melastigma]